MIKLTKQEEKILDLLVQGKTNKEIAEEIFVSVHTVKLHLEKLFDKFSVKNRVQLAIKYYLRGEGK